MSWKILKILKNKIVKLRNIYRADQDPDPVILVEIEESIVEDIIITIKIRGKIEKRIKTEKTKKKRKTKNVQIDKLLLKWSIKFI